MTRTSPAERMPAAESKLWTDGTAHPRAQRQPSRRDRMEPFLNGTTTGPSATPTTLPLLLYKTGLSPVGQLLELMAQS